MNTPMVKIPNKGPFVMASRLMVNCRTVPMCSTMYTRNTHNTPTDTTTERIIQLMAVSDNGLLTKGLIKSSNTTADMEFRQVDKELKAALNTPAMKRPVKPGYSPKVSITNSGNS